MRFIDCQGLAGHDTLGAVQAGFTLIHRASLGKFGDEVVSANRHLLGDEWEQDPGNGALDWEPKRAALVLGTPPCSGFSSMNQAKKGTPNARGVNSAINSCMRELVQYASRCSGEDGRRGVEVVIFESVQQAYTQGRSLMQALRDLLEAETGSKYNLTHVLMSGAAVGAAQFRHRYFFVAHRVPFGVDQPHERSVATVYDAIGDLRLLPVAWTPQARTLPSTQYVVDERLADCELIDAHQTFMGPEEDLYIELLLDHWTPGDGVRRPLERYLAGGGKLEGRAERWWDHNATEDEHFKIWGGPRRLAWDRPSYVLTGNSIKQFVHPSEPRFITAREGSRLMGLPDSWAWPEERLSRVCSYLGKCCPVASARWISGWAREALEGRPGERGNEIGEREYLHRSTNIYKSWPVGVESSQVPLVA